jgi:hypothetical protein
MRARDAESRGEWLNGGHVLVVDDVEHDDTPSDPPFDDRLFGQGDLSLGFNLGELDPDLAALLSPNHITKSKTSMPAPRRLASKSFDIPREVTLLLYLKSHLRRMVSNPSHLRSVILSLRPDHLLDRSHPTFRAFVWPPATQYLCSLRKRCRRYRPESSLHPGPLI